MTSFHPAPGDVHSWCVNLNVSPEISGRLYATLTPDERDRSARFRFERDRRRFIVARGTLRELLGCCLQIQPGRVKFVYNAFGKPDISPEFGSRLTFNLSHSADLALVAITTAAQVGVDLEYIRSESDCADIARRFYSVAEVDGLNALPSHLYAEAFFHFWTKREAYLKARGEGLSVTSNDVVPARGWSCYALHPPSGYVAALVVRGNGWRVRQSGILTPTPAPLAHARQLIDNFTTKVPPS